MNEKTSKIKEYWDTQAKTNACEEGSTLRDSNLRELEITTLLSYIKENSRVLDIGCGNGYSTIIFAKNKNINIIGADYSKRMIKNANQSLYNNHKQLKNTRFEIQDILNTSYEDNYFDIVISERCLINIDTWEKQKKGILEIHRVLKKGGTFLMLEGSNDGMKKLNEIREKLGLGKINIIWHNLFFDDTNLKEFTSNYFNIIEINNFCSTYMIISRALHPKLKTPDYNADINKYALMLPNMGDYGYLKIYVLNKK